MITSKILFVLCLAIICHVIVCAAVIKSTGNDTHISASYTAYPNHDENQYTLPLHLTKPAIVQVYNYGPYGSKVDIYDHHQKIGESDSYNNIGRVYLSKGDHSLSLRPYYDKTEDSLSTHFVKVHVLPKSRAYFLKKRDPVYNNADVYTPEYNAYVQWDYDGSSKHYRNGGDDSVPKHYHNDEDDDDEDEDDCDEDEDDNYGEWDKSYNKDTSMDKHWWKWHKKGGWKKNKKVIYVSTVHYSEPTTPAPITVTSTQTVDHTDTIHYTSTIPQPPTPSPLERIVTETVMKTGPTETVQKPGTTETVNKAGPTETTTVTMNGATAEATVILPIMINTVTEYRNNLSIPIPTDNLSVEMNRIVTVTAEGGVTTIPGSPITISNSPVTVTMSGQITTIFPEPVTLINEPVTVSNEPITVTSTVGVDVTHYLFRQTVMQTIFQTDTELVTVAFTSHNEVLQTVVGTATTTENVVITVISTRPRTTATRTPTPSITPP
ncbi:hypothetical protein HPULCUR_003950 [Helicostylum pulchrum]|uniref:Uncharacterized protein n=1 Tax=Helicostylum pulchrum TaxID=562976 RepID=A0ABP9XW53_9FUNG